MLQVEARDASTIQSRGGSRYKPKADRGFETTLEPFTTAKKLITRGNFANPTRKANNAIQTTEHTRTVISSSPRNSGRTRGASRHRLTESTHDLTKAASGDRRYLPEPTGNRRTKPINDDVHLQGPYELSSSSGRTRQGSSRSRRTNKEAERRMDTTGPAGTATEVLTVQSGRKSANRYPAVKRTAEGSTENPEEARGTSRSRARRIIERSTRRHDIVPANSDQINVANVSPRRSPTRSRGIENSTTNATRGISRRGSSKTSDSSINANTSNTTEEMKRKNSRTSSKTRSKNPPVKSTVQKTDGKTRNTTPRVIITRDNSTQGTVIPYIASESAIALTEVLLSTTARTTTESLHRRRAAATTITDEIIPKEDFFNRGLGFRGRKFHTEAPLTTSTTPRIQTAQQTGTPVRGNPGWTLHRRPAHKGEIIAPASTTTSTNSNEIPTTTDKKKPTGGAGRRGSKVFNKASIILKIDRELDETDNYPPEFKAKIAKLVSLREILF